MAITGETSNWIIMDSILQFYITVGIPGFFNNVQQAKKRKKRKQGPHIYIAYAKKKKKKALKSVHHFSCTTPDL